MLNWRNWLIGAYIVEFEQSGEDRAKYGEKVLETLASGFRRDSFTELSISNLINFRQVALSWPLLPIHQTVSGELGNLPASLRDDLMTNGRKTCITNPKPGNIPRTECCHVEID